jgi:hypothetical protein
VTGVKGMPHAVKVLGRRAGGCVCGKRLLLAFNEGTCLCCGHGDVQPAAVPYGARPSRLRRLPRDLGAFQREGRRPDPNLENVVRLDRLRDRWKVPRLELIEGGAMRANEPVADLEAAA